MRLAIILLCGFLTPLLGHANPTHNMALLDKAFVSMVEKDFAKSFEIAQTLLDELKLNTIEEISFAHKILGLAHCETGNFDQGLEHFETLKTFSPNASLDGIQTSKTCKNLFEKKQMPKVKKSKKEPEPEYSTPTDNLDSQSTTKGTYGSRLIPFGVGQFKNDQNKKGVAFLVGQTLLYSTAAITLSMHANNENKGLRDFGYATLATGGFVSLWGIVDAVKTFKKQK